MSSHEIELEVSRAAYEASRAAASRELAPLKDSRAAIAIWDVRNPHDVRLKYANRPFREIFGIGDADPVAGRSNRDVLAADTPAAHALPGITGEEVDAIKRMGEMHRMTRVESQTRGPIDIYLTYRIVDRHAPDEMVIAGISAVHSLELDDVESA